MKSLYFYLLRRWHWFWFRVATADGEHEIAEMHWRAMQKTYRMNRE